MGILDIFRTKNSKDKITLVTDTVQGYISWNGKLYQSDIIRAAIRPKIRAIGKAVAKHIRTDEENNRVNTNTVPYIRYLLEEPNSYMTGQDLQEKLALQLELNNNAFAYLERNQDGLVMAIYPINALSVEVRNKNDEDLKLVFQMPNGKSFVTKYTNVLHIRKDFADNSFFGENPMQALKPLMEVVTVTDQGIINAIKNSGVIRWLLKATAALRKKDLDKIAEDFAKSFMTVDRGEATGVAAIDSKIDAQQITQKDYVPNALQMDRTTDRIFSFFNVNKNIIQSNYNENEWIAYYEANIEPDLIKLSNEFTRKLFNRRERSFGNRIIFESSSLNFASMQTKLRLIELVDRGIMTPNEVRGILGYAPTEGGDIMVRRLDTRPTEEGGRSEDI